MKNYFIDKLKYYFLTRKKDREKGFSFLESLTAILVLSIAFAVNLQFLVVLKIQNLKQEVQTGAVSVSKEILDDLRYRLSNNLGTVASGKTEITNRSSFGYSYDADVYVCNNEPTIDAQNTVTACPTATGSNIRYIVVQVLDKKRNNEKVYTVQTIFTTLQ
ncbi:type II secretion system protein [Geminocystis sp. NIES-3709]|uniref:type IV pilus modification PilV family protein n=1 Tax=Geminocystis sp. NIES-3709 TaxID=1617448 RepID=UPI0005FC5F16|nr:type II secretion system protein [Geminocystis sp. NIES-3709]BAQ64565.1 hypothetical protein GM3709_1330 [Geminocystis sp. NIES-3709]